MAGQRMRDEADAWRGPRPGFVRKHEPTGLPPTARGARGGSFRPLGASAWAATTVSGAFGAGFVRAVRSLAAQPGYEGSALLAVSTRGAGGGVPRCLDAVASASVTVGQNTTPSRASNCALCSNASG